MQTLCGVKYCTLLFSQLLCQIAFCFSIFFVWKCNKIADLWWVTYVLPVSTVRCERNKRRPFITTAHYVQRPSLLLINAFLYVLVSDNGQYWRQDCSEAKCLVCKSLASCHVVPRPRAQVRRYALLSEDIAITRSVHIRPWLHENHTSGDSDWKDDAGPCLPETSDGRRQLKWRLIETWSV